MQSGQTKEGILAEVDIMASLRHPNICNIYGVTFISDDVLWIILPFIEQSLDRILYSRTTPLPLPLQHKLIVQAINAVNYIHNLQDPILHRDLKASNFLFQRPDKLLLTDFGTAKFKKNVHHTSNCTWNWAAPEILQAEPKWSEKADIYSLGMVLFEIVSRRTPFEHVEEFAMVVAIQKGERPAIPASCPAV